MYSMVMMMAVASGGDVASFGGRNKGCNGCDGGSCHGVVVSNGCSGSSCHGGGFLGGRGKGCCGGGGFLGLRGKHSCNGGGASCMGSSCHGGGASCMGSSCHGGMAMPAVPHVAHDAGCALPAVGAPVMVPSTPAMSMPAPAPTPAPEPKKEEAKEAPKKGT